MKMQEIRCPRCGEVFEVDQTRYDEIAQQIRDKEFDRELQRREKELEDRQEDKLKLFRMQNEKEHADIVSKKDSELSAKDRTIAQLQERLNASKIEKDHAIFEAIAKKDEEISKDAKEHTETLKQKDNEIASLDKIITDLRAKLDASEVAKDYAISQAMEKKNAEISRDTKAHSESLREKESEIADRDKLIAALRSKLQVNEAEKELAVSEAIDKKNAEISSRDTKIAELEAKIRASETEKKLAVAEAVEEKNKEISEKASEIADLKGELKTKETENKLSEQNLKEQYEGKLKSKDELIEYYKDFKARQSTKMIGESLEQHCLTQFNSIRMTAFPNAYFEKDNDAKSGSKGDFIYREYGEDGVEFISIMFEMKNEADKTVTKHKNEDFLKELDKDRKEKGCEYAILVSLLEIDSELYNNGIVDVSYKYPKMYVIRPQFFIPIITLLRNAAKNSLEYRQQLQIVRNQQIDISHFEEEMELFKKGFARNYRLASDKFALAIKEIDKTIDSLRKIKDALISSENNLRLANNKADELTIKKLTKNAPSIRSMFDDLESVTTASSDYFETTSSSLEMENGNRDEEVVLNESVDELQENITISAKSELGNYSRAIDELIIRTASGEAYRTMEEIKYDNPDLADIIEEMKERAKEVFGIELKDYLIYNGILKK